MPGDNARFRSREDGLECCGEPKSSYTDPAGGFHSWEISRWQAHNQAPKGCRGLPSHSLLSAVPSFSRQTHLQLAVCPGVRVMAQHCYRK